MCDRWFINGPGNQYCGPGPPNLPDLLVYADFNKSASRHHGAHIKW